MSDLADYGWAPGNYNAICTVCKKQHIDTDKRSACCKECAQDAKIKALEAALKWHCDHYASTDLNHQDYRVKSYTIAVEALGIKNIGDMFCDDIAASLLEEKP